jgi:hypothetical protein
VKFPQTPKVAYRRSVTRHDSIKPFAKHPRSLLTKGVSAKRDGACSFRATTLRVSRLRSASKCGCIWQGVRATHRRSTAHLPWHLLSKGGLAIPAMASPRGFQPDLNTARDRAISTQLCVTPHLRGEIGVSHLCCLRAELRGSSVRICPNAFRPRMAPSGT